MENVQYVKRRYCINDLTRSRKEMLFNIQGRRVLENKKVSVTNAEGPPVPIPNTEVKLCSGEDTLRVTVRENSSMLTSAGRAEISAFPNAEKMRKKTKDLIYGGVAQLGEHLPCKQGVMGSNPIISTIGTKVPFGTFVPILVMVPTLNTDCTAIKGSNCAAIC